MYHSKAVHNTLGVSDQLICALLQLYWCSNLAGIHFIFVGMCVINNVNIKHVYLCGGKLCSTHRTTYCLTYYKA